MSPWWPLQWLPSWYPNLKSNLSNSFEDRAPVDFTNRCPIFKWVAGTWLHDRDQGLYSLSGRTSYRKISWSLEAARFIFRIFQSLWKLTGTSAAALPRCLSNFKAIYTIIRSRGSWSWSWILIGRSPCGAKRRWVGLQHTKGGFPEHP